MQRRTLSRLRSVDFYKKIPSDLTEATLTGAWLSIAASVIMALLLVLELAAFLRVQTVSELVVDRSPSNELLKVCVGGGGGQGGCRVTLWRVLCAAHALDDQKEEEDGVRTKPPPRPLNTTNDTPTDLNDPPSKNKNENNATGHVQHLLPGALVRVRDRRRLRRARHEAHEPD